MEQNRIDVDNWDEKRNVESHCRWDSFICLNFASKLFFNTELNFDSR